MDSLFDGFLVIGKDKRILFANRSAQNILGRELRPGDSCRGLFSICNSCPMEVVEDTKEGVQVYDVSIDNGKHVCLSMTPYYENGTFSGVVEVFRDVSKVIYYMEEVKKQKEFVEIVLNSIAEAVLVLDEEGRVIEHNLVAKRVLCKEFDELKGVHIDKLIGLPIHQLPQEGDRSDIYIETPCGKQKASVLVSKLKRGNGYVVSFYIIPELLAPDKENFQIISKNPKFLRVLEKVKVVADTNVNILITGETGTGKSFLARYIHLLSSRREKPFVKVNCSAIPETLIEAELFGYNRGTFTGALKDKPGKVEVADGGTLFLDEIGDLPLHLQGKLLYFLQEKEFERIGDVRPRRVDVRIVAATNKDLKKLVKEGKFREDLYYRINVFSIETPPLRERKEDIPYLVNFFVNKFSKEYRRVVKGISPSAMKLLLEYHYPGNVRELENIIESAVVVCKGSVIQEENLPEELKVCSSPISNGSDERDKIINALKQANGNKSLAAKLLGIHRTTLWRKLRELGIE